MTDRIIRQSDYEQIPTKAAPKSLEGRQAKLEMDLAKMNRAVAALKAWRKGKEGQ